MNSLLLNLFCWKRFEIDYRKDHILRFAHRQVQNLLNHVDIKAISILKCPMPMFETVDK